MAEKVTTAVAKRNEAPTVAGMIQSLVPELQRALPKHMDADRMARIALTVVRKDANLANCDPRSFAGALLTAAQLGLEPGVNEEAYLVAYGKECQLIVGYQGYAKLFWQHPLARHLDAQAVYEGDDFDWAHGLDPFLRHKPASDRTGRAITHYYAVAALSTGAKSFVVLTAAEVKQLRGGKVGASGKIADPQHWMERKTALRQLFKLVPKSASLAKAIDVDEQVGSTLRAGQEPSKALEAGPVDLSTGEILEGEVLDTPAWGAPIE